MFLNILHSGGAFWGVTAVWAVLFVIFLYQLIKGSKSGSYVNDGKGGSIPTTVNKKWTKNTFFYFLIAITVLYAFALYVIARDYKGVW